MNYGPIEPLAHPEAQQKLVGLLREGGLEPLDVEIEMHCGGVNITIEVVPPAGWFSIEGLTSRNVTGDLVRIERVERQNQIVLRDVSAAAYNLGHLIPYAMGYISREQPLLIEISLDGSPAILPSVRLTFWGRSHPIGFSPPSTFPNLEKLDDVKRAAPLIKALRLLRDHKISIDDSDLRAAFDRYAPLL